MNAGTTRLSAPQAAYGSRQRDILHRPPGGYLEGVPEPAEDASELIPSRGRRSRVGQASCLPVATASSRASAPLRSSLLTFGQDARRTGRQDACPTLVSGFAGLGTPRPTTTRRSGVLMRVRNWRSGLHVNRRLKVARTVQSFVAMRVDNPRHSRLAIGATVQPRTARKRSAAFLPEAG